MAADPRIFIRQRAAELGFGADPWDRHEPAAQLVAHGELGDELVQDQIPISPSMRAATTIMRSSRAG
ncbi:MAG: hypothetical protein B7Z09_12590 [Brevundimonas diminuta]|nr:MAG: hypothetical protein B7Z09_12590 [Brevundimonas diminuta]